MLNEQKLWTLSGLAEEFEMTWRTVKKRMKNIPPDGKTHQGYDGWHLLKAAEAILDTPDKSVSTNPNNMDARNRLYHYQAENLKIKLTEQKSKLLRSDDVIPELEKVRQEIIELFTNMPDEFRKNMDLSDKAIQVLERECHRMIESLQSKSYFNSDD